MTSIQSILPDAVTKVGDATSSARWKDLYNRTVTALYNQPNFRQELAKVLDTGKASGAVDAVTSAATVQSSSLAASAVSVSKEVASTAGTFSAAVNAYLKNNLVAGAQALSAARHASATKTTNVEKNDQGAQEI